MVRWINAKRYVHVKKDTPYPSHRDCAHYLIDVDSTWNCAHGFIQTKSGGVKSYAWLMKGNKILDVKANKTYTKKSFLKAFKVIAADVYSFAEVKANMRKFRRYGRWEIV